MGRPERIRTGGIDMSIDTRVPDAAGGLPAPYGVDELAAREAIRELVAAYTHLGDSGRLDEMVELFEPDATLDAFDRTYVGAEQIRGFFSGIVSDRSDAPRRSFVRHHIANVTIDVDIDAGTATGASYWAVYSDDGFESSGRYRDRYRRSNEGRWRFQVRKIRRDRAREEQGRA